MILFGWPRRTKHYGPAYPSVCDQCQQDTYFHLLKIRRWLTLYFIPVLPLSSATWSLVCQVCERTAVIEDKDEIAFAKEAARLTATHTDHAMDSEEYWTQIQPLFDKSEFFGGRDAEEIGAVTEIDAEVSNRGFQ